MSFNNKDLFDLIKNQDKPKPVSKKTEKIEKSLFGDEKRDESQKQNVHKVLIYSLWVLWVVVISLFIVRGMHYVLPEHFAWLGENKLQSLDKFLFSGTVGALLGKFGDKIFPGNK